MSRRFLTAREQYEMLAPWRVAMPRRPEDWDTWPPELQQAHERSHTIRDIAEKHTDLPTDEVAGYGWLPTERWSRPPAKYKGLEQSIKQKGMLRPIDLVHNGQEVYLEDGHHRAEAAQGWGHPTVPVRVTQGEVPPDKARPIGRGLAGWLGNQHTASLTLRRVAAEGTTGENWWVT